MLIDNVRIKNVTQSANADTGQVAITSPSTLRTLALQDNGTVRRVAGQLGELIISQAASKEAGAGGKRTLFRVNLKRNGLLSAASAHLVITSSGAPDGGERASEAVGLLLSALLNAAIEETYTPSAEECPLGHNATEVGYPEMVVNLKTSSTVDAAVSVANLVRRLVVGEA